MTVGFGPVGACHQNLEIIMCGPYIMKHYLLIGKHDHKAWSQEP